ncbi:MAG: ClpXP protease specificity-enhancing factor [Neisseria sp.]|nr:ClpXP protease specificity-enhancing factor [Neisseria sp.]
MMTSTKPYFLRALYEWCCDNGQTPYLVAWVNEQTKVPLQYVRDEQIVLNIGMNAVQNLLIDNEWVNFSARFNGVAQDIWIPVGHVASLFAKESGEGMGFEIEPLEVQQPEEKRAKSVQKTVSKSSAESDNRESSGDKPKKKILKFGQNAE